MKRLSLAEAEKAVEDFLKKEKEPQLQSEVRLKELTTAAVWDKLNAQVFKLATPVGPIDFVLTRGKVIKVGIGFGGHGVNSICVADLAGNGRPMLVYTFSWGSGIHRSQIGVLDCQARSPDGYLAEQSFYEHAADWTVRATGATTVQVEAGGVKLGTLELAQADGKTSLRVRVADDVPASLRDKVRANFR